MVTTWKPSQTPNNIKYVCVQSCENICKHILLFYWSKGNLSEGRHIIKKAGSTFVSIYFTWIPTVHIFSYSPCAVWSSLSSFSCSSLNVVFPLTLLYTLLVCLFLTFKHFCTHSLWPSHFVISNNRTPPGDSCTCPFYTYNTGFGFFVDTFL